MAGTGPAWNWTASRPGIAKQLYPDATIFAKGFEETPLPDNYFDVRGRERAVRRLRGPRSCDEARHDARRSTTTSLPSRLRRCGLAACWRSSPAGTRWTRRTSPSARASASKRRPARRDPAPEHRLQGKCRHGGHDRHPVPAEARARRSAFAGHAWRRLGDGGHSAATTGHA